MLCSLKDLDGFELAATDGDIGRVKEIYFDDHYWVVRHLVVETGGWLSGRRVLISPHSVLGTSVSERSLRVALTRQQVQDAPGIETDKPVSRQHEIAVYDYYRYPYYWGGSGLWGMMDVPLGGMIPAVPGVDPEALRELQAAAREASDPHLRSSAEVIGYDITARDGDIGHVDDFLFDDHSWAIRFAVVDTNNWLPDRLVLLSPRAIEAVDWTERSARLKVTRATVESSPPYVRGADLSDDDVRAVQLHFERS